mmetsp:Transcript_9995/g.19248  ORF Transcript_9995/g.19248 Transcript_9995/m.19248 type:complete len:610 (+) Transcript_9995:64-1893(+)
MASSEDPESAIPAAGTGETSSSSNYGYSDAVTFPRFAPFLAATHDYRDLSGSRFRVASFDGLPRAAGSSHDGGTTNGDAPTSEKLLATKSSEARLEAKRLAEPAVREYANRLLQGEVELLEEMERASRIVMAECVRNAVLAACRRLDLWPPLPPPAGVEASDCTYEDMSASMDVIAQRMYNDQTRRLRGEAFGSCDSLACRALTASYLVDFAHEVGAPMPPVSQTYSTMLEDLELRVAEWEYMLDSAEPGAQNVDQKTDSSGSSFARAASLLGSLSLRAAAERLRTTDTQQLMNVAAGTGEAADAGGSYGQQLVLDDLAVEDLSVSDGQKVYMEVAFGQFRQRTPASALFGSSGSQGARFESACIAFAYGASRELAIRIRCWDRLNSLLHGDPIVGEIELPIGPELEDCQPRKVVLPISRNAEHSGTVSFRVFLRNGLQAPLEQPTVPSQESFSGRAGSRLGSFATAGIDLGVAAGSAVGGVAGSAVNVLGGAVGGAVAAAASVTGPAVNASVRVRTGNGTCPQEQAAVIIVTEEGTGMCFVYPYRTRAEADAYFNARTWRLTSRIMFSSQRGVVVEELKQGGLSMPYGTIRKAAFSLQQVPEGDSAPP